MKDILILTVNMANVKVLGLEILHLYVIPQIGRWLSQREVQVFIRLTTLLIYALSNWIGASLKKIPQVLIILAALWGTGLGAFNQIQGCFHNHDLIVAAMEP